MQKELISTPNAPAAVGPYSQGVKAGPYVFVSGQLPLDPATGELISGGIKEKTVRVIENIKAVLEAAGTSLSGVVKATIFLKDMSDFAAVNGVYAEYFGGALPARAAVQVAGLPKGADIEMEVIAFVQG